jgi:predicted enzyme related to lactoylglutathione lyase
MVVKLGNITFDCEDVLRVATFWSTLLGRPLDEGSSELFASIGGTDGARPEPAWYFNKVPEPKTAKNRCHVDLHAEDRPAVAAEVKRLTDLGGTVIREPKEEFGYYWATLQDPEGNEFCIGAA